MTASVRAVPMPRPRSASSTKIIPTQPTGPVDGRDAGPDDLVVDLGHERDAAGMVEGEPEEPAPVAPAAADHDVGGRLDVVGLHRADPLLLGHRPIVAAIIGAWPP